MMPTPTFPHHFFVASHGTQLRKAAASGWFYATAVLGKMLASSCGNPTKIGWIAATGGVTKRVLPQVGRMEGVNERP